VKSVFTHGVGLGLARNDKRDLRATTDDFIASTVLVNPPLRVTGGRAPGPFPQRRVTIGDRPGLHTVVSTISEATGGFARIEIYTALLRDGTLFYVLAVTPRDSVLDYAATFRRIIRSIAIMDSDGCVR
jgi:hypothetical protein